MRLDKKDKILAGTYRRLLMVQILSMITGLLGPFVDGIVVSNYLGSLRMAAFGLASPLPIILVTVASIFEAGSQALSGRYLGTGQVEKVNGLMTMILSVTALCGLVFTLLYGCCSYQVAAFLGAGQDCLADCADYIRGFGWGVIPTMLGPVLIGYMQIDQDGKRAIFSAIVMLLVNCSLDLAVAFVYPDKMFGMGLSTAISQWVAFGILMLHFLKKNRTLSFCFKNIPFHLIGQVFVVGFPSAVFHLCNVVRTIVLNRILLHISDTHAVAALTVQNSMLPLIMGVILGCGVTSLLITSVIAGEENRRSLRKIMAYILRLSFLIAFGIGLFLFLGAKVPVAYLFCGSEPPAQQALVARILRFYAISIPLCMLNSIMIFYYQSMRRNLISNLLCVLDNAGFLIASALILPAFLGLDGVWVSFITTELLSMLFLFILVGISQKKIPSSLHDYLLLPDSFGVDAEHRLNITAASMEEVTGISGRIITFCKAQELPEKTAMAAGLCMEELCAIVMKNSKKAVTVDVYLTYKDGNLLLRLRDNGTPFDMALLQGAENPQNPGENAGLRILHSMAKSIGYTVVLGLNVFSIQI